MSDGDNRGTFDIAVPSTDPERKDADEPKSTGGFGQGDKEKDDKDAQEMSEEDAQLKAELEMLVERLKESDTGLYLPALESLRTLIRTSTSSMTSVPKPLKFLRPHYDELGSIRNSWNKDLKDQRALLASILSVLAMTYSDTGKRDTLYYRLISQSSESPGSWGHEYVRHLAAELGEEYNAEFAGKEDDEVKQEPDAPMEEEESRTYTDEQLKGLAGDLVDFFLKHNAEADAVDLVLELEHVESLVEKVDDKTWPRVCQYMVNCVPLLVAPDDTKFLETAAQIYAKHDRYPEALALAVRLGNRHLIQQYYSAPTNPVMQKQLSYFLARAQTPLFWVHTSDEMEPDIENGPPNQPEDVVGALGNEHLSVHFRNFGKAVGVEEERKPEDVYKAHLETSRHNATSTGSAISKHRENIAKTFVNAFVNAGFGNETLIVNDPNSAEHWLFKNNHAGIRAGAASVGMSMLWDTESGIDHIDKYSYSADENIKAGGIFATGIMHAGIRREPDIPWALLEDHLDSKTESFKHMAMMGIAVSHAGWHRLDISATMLPHIAEEKNSMQTAALAALTLGFTFVGSGDGEIASTILQTMMERSETELNSEWTIFMSLALGLVFLGCQDAAEATVETLHAIEHPMARTAEILVETCSYAGTGNVLKVQKMLHICSERLVKPEKEENADQAEAEAEEEEVAPEAEGEGPAAPATPAAAASSSAPRVPGAATATAPGAAADAATAEPTETAEETEAKAKAKDVGLKFQSVAVIGIALIAMGEEVGSEMALRHFQHLMTYGEPQIRKAVPLALGLISASRPQLPILDTLSKYSHDSDLDVAINAIFAMGLVGAGTNNARLAQMLRQLAVYYAREPDCYMIVRIAQGLVHMGKGTIGLNPFFHDGQIMSKSAMAGLLSVIISFTDVRSIILKDSPWILFLLVTAMYPQFLITLDEETEEKAVTVRVGQAVNTVGLAGTRMGISGFQTHQTPVRIATGERAELGTNEYFPYSSVLEGLVILKKNEGYDAEDQ